MVNLSNTNSSLLGYYSIQTATWYLVTSILEVLAVSSCRIV